MVLFDDSISVNEAMKADTFPTPTFLVVPCLNKVCPNSLYCVGDTHQHFHFVMLLFVDCWTWLTLTGHSCPSFHFLRMAPESSNKSLTDIYQLRWPIQRSNGCKDSGYEFTMNQYSTKDLRNSASKGGQLTILLKADHKVFQQ